MRQKIIFETISTTQGSQLGSGLQFNIKSRGLKTPMEIKLISKASEQILDEPRAEVEPQPVQGESGLNRASGLKNRVWALEEHLQYLVFLDLNKERTKSKLVRHSNNFFKEMSEFLKSKTDIQCRSHHHKYQEKYKYPYRIIKEERNKLEALGLSYSGALSRFSQVSPDCGFRETVVKEEEAPVAVRREVAEVSCQTDIQGVQTTLISQEEYERRLVVPSPMYQMASPYPVASPYPIDYYSMQGMMGRYY